ncbi:GNAT family N-acetyltransferase [Lachnospiraceae bacterium 62-35]
MYRKATLDDCEKVYRLICDMEHKQLPFERFYTIFQKQIGKRHHYFLVCEHDNNVIGVLHLRFEEQLHHSECIAEIMEFAVDATYRKQGIGKEMFIKACQIAKDFACTQIEVACNQLRENTHRFYLREGMHNFHFKFSKSLVGDDTAENAIGK